MECFVLHPVNTRNDINTQFYYQRLAYEPFDEQKRGSKFAYLCLLNNNNNDNNNNHNNNDKNN